MKARIIAAALICSACATVRYGPSVVRWIDPPDPAALRLEPVVPERSRCLEAPYFASSLNISFAEREAPSPADDVLRDLGPVHVEGDPAGRGYVMILGAGPELESEARLAFLVRHRDELHAMPGVECSGYKLCPGGDLCPSICLALCSQTVRELAGRLQQLAYRDPAVAGRSLPIHVELKGAVRPRCPAEGGCDPLAYDKAKYKPSARRGVLSTLTDAPPECRSDRECSVSGCGNSCAPWPTSDVVGTCEYRGELSSAFCGCVEGRCGWFVQ